MFHMEHQLVHPKHSKTFGTNLGCTGNSFRPEFRAGTYKKTGLVPAGNIKNRTGTRISAYIKKKENFRNLAKKPSYIESLSLHCTGQHIFLGRTSKSFFSGFRGH